MNEKKTSLEFKNPKKPNHNKKSIGWWVGVIVLILVSVTFVLPAAGIGSLFSKSEIVFGTYNGKDIAYKPGNYFYNQVQNLYSNAGSNAETQTMQIWQEAYQNTLLHTALTQEAEKAGIKTVEESVNNAILQTGYYNNEDGKFDVQKYNETPKVEKDNIYSQIEDSVLANTVLTDYQTVLSSSAEAEFVAQMGTKARSFEYVPFTSSSYPDADAVEYYTQNIQAFTAMDLSMVVVATEADADALSASLLSGSAKFEDEESKQDLGLVSFSALGSIIYDEEDKNEIFSLAKDSYSTPYLTQYGYAIFKANSTPDVLDITKVETLNEVKAVIASQDSEAVAPFIKEAAEAFSKNPNWDAENKVVVAATNNNPANSGLLSSFAYTDPSGLLAAAGVENNEVLFTAELNETLAPMAANGNYIVARAVADEEIPAMVSSYIYNYYASNQFIPTDLFNSINLNPEYEDNFFTTLLTEVFATN